MAYFSAKRSGVGARHARSCECAVREPTRCAVGKLIRLQYDLPDLLARHALAWVALPVGVEARSSLFDADQSIPWMYAVRHDLLSECIALTK